MVTTGVVFSFLIRIDESAVQQQAAGSLADIVTSYKVSVLQRPTFAFIYELLGMLSDNFYHVYRSLFLN
jgi:hypothetical protein